MRFILPETGRVVDYFSLGVGFAESVGTQHELEVSEPCRGRTGDTGRSVPRWTLGASAQGEEHDRSSDWRLEDDNPGIDSAGTTVRFDWPASSVGSRHMKLVITAQPSYIGVSRLIRDLLYQNILTWPTY